MPPNTVVQSGSKITWTNEDKLPTPLPVEIAVMVTIAFSILV
jgi:hypothetical protein